MLEEKCRMLRHLGFISFVSASSLLGTGGAALGKDAVEAAQELASTSQSDPNGFMLMVVSICMLFVCALSLIIATSVQAFKKKPAVPAAGVSSAKSKEASTVG